MLGIYSYNYESLLYIMVEEAIFPNKFYRNVGDNNFICYYLHVTMTIPVLKQSENMIGAKRNCNLS